MSRVVRSCPERSVTCESRVDRAESTGRPEVPAVRARCSGCGRSRRRVRQRLLRRDERGEVDAAVTGRELAAEHVVVHGAQVGEHLGRKVIDRARCPSNGDEGTPQPREQGRGTPYRAVRQGTSRSRLPLHRREMVTDPGGRRVLGDEVSPEQTNRHLRVAQVAVDLVCRVGQDDAIAHEQCGNGHERRAPGATRPTVPH